MAKIKISLVILLLGWLTACVNVADPGRRSDSSSGVQAESGTEPESGLNLKDNQVEFIEPVAKAEVLALLEPQKAVTLPLQESIPPVHEEESPLAINPVIKLCEEVGAKLGSVSVEDCLTQNLTHSGFSTENRSLAFKDYPPLPGREPLGKVLVIGGIHGDEFSSVSVIVKWMKILNQHHSGLFHWRFVPTANPDGLLQKSSQRQNFNGVDLNRNFPTADWQNEAISYWETVTHKNPRRHPGTKEASEKETQWLVKQIDEFAPDVIISMHAPYHLVDYDGPPSPPKALGELYLRQLGVYPGSLGNYAGNDLQMPIVTVELKSAGIMPGKAEVDQMWYDLVRWLRGQLSQ